MKRILVVLFLCFILPQGANAFDYYIVTGPNQWLPTTAISYPVLYGTYTDEYQTTIRRMTNEPGGGSDEVKPPYPAKVSTVENLDGTMFFAYSQYRSTSTYFSIFTTADGTYRCNLSQWNHGSAISYDNFKWSNTVANEGYLLIQSKAGFGNYATYPVNFYKITINTSTWVPTAQLLYSMPTSDFPACPSGEQIYVVRTHDEGPASWDGRYWPLVEKCTNDSSGENATYAIIVLDRDKNGFESPGVQGTVILPPRQTSNCGISAAGGYLVWAEIQSTLAPGICSSTNPTLNMTCEKFLPLASIVGSSNYNNYQQLAQPLQSIAGHWHMGYDDLGNEIYVTGNLINGPHGYDLGYYKFKPPGPFITTIPWNEWKEGQYMAGFTDVHYIVAGSNPGPREWTAVVTASASSSTDECGYEINGTSTITFVHNSATNQRVFRLAHERNEATNYATEPFGGGSRDGNSFYFDSNWCLGESQQLLRAEMPANWWNEVLGASGLPPARPPGLRIIPK